MKLKDLLHNENAETAQRILMNTPLSLYCRMIGRITGDSRHMDLVAKQIISAIDETTNAEAVMTEVDYDDTVGRLLLYAKYCLEIIDDPEILEEPLLRPTEQDIINLKRCAYLIITELIMKWPLMADRCCSGSKTKNNDDRSLLFASVR